MLIEITYANSWYKDKVGERFEVEKETTYFRENGGGKRVPHYLHQIEPNQYRLIDCRHARIVTDLKPPYHKHDCEVCEYLGSEEIAGKQYDGYYCEQGSNTPTIIVRYGNEGEYSTYWPISLEETPIPKMPFTMLLALRFYTQVFTKKEALHRNR